jgi:hypothetical protein
MQPEAMAGEWDVYSNGVHSTLKLMPDGTFTHMLWGGVQGYWGHWSLLQAPEGPVLRFDLAGAQPEVYNGFSGPMTMQWPQQENWLITGMMGNQITTTDSILQRKGAQQAAAPFPSFVQQWQNAAEKVNAFWRQQGLSQNFAPQPQPFLTESGVPVEQFPSFFPDPQATAGPQPAPQVQAAPAPQPNPQPQPVQPNGVTAAQQAAMAAQQAATNDQIRQIYAGMAQQSWTTTNTINNQWQQLHEAQIASIQQMNVDTMNNTHAMAQKFIQFAKS